MKKLIIFTISLLISQTATCMDIWQAIQTGNLRRVQELINENPEVVNAQNTINQTPLHIAAYNGHTNVATILLDHGANIDAQDDFNQTPLHAAAYNGHAAVATVLLDHNATVDALDNCNHTPLHRAISMDHADVEQLLKDWPHYKDAELREREKMYTFLSAQHERCGTNSPAHDLPQLCCQHIAKFICPVLMQKNCPLIFSDNSGINLFSELTAEQIHQIANQERERQQQERRQHQNNSWCSIQ